MRVLVVSTAKVGNAWVEALLAELYGLDVLRKVPPTADEFLQFAFPDDAIFRQHFVATDEVIAHAASIDCALVTPVRDPYDTFVSLYHYVQNFKRTFKAKRDPGIKLIDRPLDHPDVLDYLATDFAWALEMELGWLRRAQREETSVVRYEDLQRDAPGTLAALTAALGDALSRDIDAAIRACSAEQMRKRHRSLRKHIRRATTGDGRAELGEAHFEIFRQCHADRVRELGYDLL